jgi:hypothetical protein
MTKPRTAREQANDLLVSLSGRDDAVAIVEAFIKLTRADERERCAKIADKQADTLRRAAHVVQQPTEEALRVAELAILQLNDTARAIRRDSTGEEGS